MKNVIQLAERLIDHIELLDQQLKEAQELMSDGEVVEKYEVMRCFNCGEMDVPTVCHCGEDRLSLVKVIIVKDKQ